MPRWLDAKRVTFKYGLGDEFIGILKTLNQLGLDKTEPIRVRSKNGPVEVAPRDVVAAGLPDPATLGPRMTGKTCAGLWVTGTGVDGRPARCTCTTSPTTSGRWPSTRASASCGRPRSTPSSPSSCLRPGRGAARACWAPRPSTRSPSSISWRGLRRRAATASAGGSRSAAPHSGNSNSPDREAVLVRFVRSTLCPWSRHRVRGRDGNATFRFSRSRAD